MKNEKYCFKKSTGVIALVGIVLVATALLLGGLPNAPTSTSTRAFGKCPDNAFAVDSCSNEQTAQDTNGVIKVGAKTCCYYGTVYTTHCLRGTTPDRLGLCPLYARYGNAITKDGKKVPCCNWIGTVQKNSSGDITSEANLTKRKEDTATTEVDRSANTSTTSPYPLPDPSFCKSLGLFQVPTMINESGTVVAARFVNDYYNDFCKQNENIFKWNGGYGGSGKWGAKAICYLPNGICAVSANCDGYDCLRGKNANGTGQCLNRPVEFKKCVDTKISPAPKQADPATPDAERCSGTCYGGITIGKCAPGYPRKCECTYASTGLLYPKYMDNIACAPQAKTCLNQVADWIKLGSQTCGGFAKYNECTKDKFRCGCDAAGKYKYPTLQKDINGCTDIKTI